MESFIIRKKNRSCWRRIITRFFRFFFFSFFRDGKGNGSLHRFWQVIVVVPRWLNEEGSFGGPVIDSGYRLSPWEIRFAMELLPLLLLCLLIAQPTAYSLSIKNKLNPRIVQTRYGEVQGLIRSFENAKFLKPIDVYLGIPYATPPVGSNRFSPTRAPSPWEGVRFVLNFSFPFLFCFVLFFSPPFFLLPHFKCTLIIYDNYE